jgi:uroporphyrinogen decarboxylase
VNSRERFQATVAYKTPDRPLISPLLGQPEIWLKIYDHLGISFPEEIRKAPPGGSRACEVMRKKIGEDFRSVEPEAMGNAMRNYENGIWEGLYGEKYRCVSFGRGSYSEPYHLTLKDICRIDELKSVRLPSPDWYDYSGILAECQKHEGYAMITGRPGYVDFINGIGFARGVEQVLVDIATEDRVFLRLVDQRFEFFFEKIRRTLEAAQGRIDVVHMGDDLGNQNGPIINPAVFKKLFASKYSKLFDLVHSYGAKTMLHSCGSVREFIPLLIDIGLDILDAVQTDAYGMDMRSLHSEFYKKIAFCGTLSIQSLLRSGTEKEIREEIGLRKRLFKEGGIVIGPANIMQVDMPVSNFVTMCESIGCLK